MDERDLDQKLREVVRAAYANATATKARFDRAGIKPDDIQTVADLAKVPVLPKDDLVALQQADPPFGGMLAVSPREISHIFFSPGPIYEPPASADNDESGWEAALSCFTRTGFEAGDVVLNSFSYHLVPAGFLFEQALVRLGCTVIPAGVGNSELQVQMMRDLGVTGYAGTPSFLMSLIRKAEEMGFDFRKDFKLRKAIVSAEPLPPDLRQKLESYGLTVGNAYGTADFGLLALNLGQGMAMQLLAEPIVEVVDPDTGQRVGPGETGEVVVTNFSRVYPLIRLGTGDMAMNLDPNPGQSRQEERSIILVGRSGDAAKVRGMFVHPNQLRFAAGQIPGVQVIQGVVSRPQEKDHFVLRVAIDEGTDQATAAEQISQAVQSVCRVRVDDVEFVEPGTITAESPGMVDRRDWG